MKIVLHIFEGVGVELEYMIVDKETLKVRPIADELIREVAGKYISDVERGKIEWSNELVLHVIELKTNGPRTNLCKLAEDFHDNILVMNNILKKYNSMLLPTGAHPFMDPFKETVLWPHQNNPIYEAYNKIFDCKGHGWSNLQSTHINLPFYNDEEFEKLHAAIRILLPILPALTASTPLLEGELTGMFDTRLEVYRSNQNKIPSIGGKIIPERLFSKKDYRENLLNKIYTDISPFDKNNILQHEWLNSRGAIARFDRNTIEIRIIDSQECISAEVAVTVLIIECLKVLVSEKWIDLNKQKMWDEEDLFKIMLKVIKNGENAVIKNKNFIRSFGLNEDQITAKKLWESIFSYIYKSVNEETKKILAPVRTILSHGSLSTRILKSVGLNPSAIKITSTYKKLSRCLQEDRLFINGL